MWPVTIASAAAVAAFLLLFAPNGWIVAIPAVLGIFADAALLDRRTKRQARTEADLRAALESMSVTDENGNAIDPSTIHVVPPEMERELRRRGERRP